MRDKIAKLDQELRRNLGTKLSNPRGATIRGPHYSATRRCVTEARSYSYSLLDAPFPVAGYRSTLCVQATRGGKSSRVRWFGQFTPKGVTDQEASRLFQGSYEDGLKALAAGFAWKKEVVGGDGLRSAWQLALPITVSNSPSAVRCATDKSWLAEHSGRV